MFSFSAVPVVGSVRGCVEPCIRSMLSKTVSEDKKGMFILNTSHRVVLYLTNRNIDGKTLYLTFTIQVFYSLESVLFRLCVLC